MDPSSVGILAHNLLSMHNLVLVAHMSKHMKFKCLRSKECMNFKKLLINFRKKGYSGIIPSVGIGKEEIHKYMQYEVSMTVFMGRIANQTKVLKWLLFEH